MLGRKGIFLVCLALMIWTLNADEQTNYYLSARRHFLNVSTALTSVSSELQNVRAELETNTRLWSESETDYKERISDAEMRESRLLEEMSRLKEEREQLAKDNENLQRDSETSTLLRRQLESERRMGDEQIRAELWRGVRWGAGGLLAVELVIVLIRSVTR